MMDSKKYMAGGEGGFFLLLFFFFLVFSFFPPLTISKVEKLRAGEMNSIMGIEGLEARGLGLMGGFRRLLQIN